MKKIVFLVLLLHDSGIDRLYAQTEPAADGPNRPKIGLALSGGGAKGFAHIGALMQLEEYGVPIDFIAGTSIGSIVGGLYAVGYTPAQMDSMIQVTDWVELFTGAAERRRLTMAEKPWDSRYMITLPIRRRSVQLPSGLLTDWKITALLSKLTWPAHNITDFNQLPIPYGCVAADIETGEAIFIRSGFLAEAMKASMAVPSVIPPVIRNGRKLVDGGLSRNLPADDVRSMGADIVVGVDVSARPKSNAELSSLFDYVNQILALHMDQFTRVQRENCDILVTPQLGELRFAAFNNTTDLIELGRNAVRAQEGPILKLLDSLAQFQDFQAKPVKIQPLQLDSLLVKNIEINGLRHVSSGLVRAELNIDAEQWITRDQLMAGVERVYNSQFFEQVIYRTTRLGDGVRLVLDLKEKNTALFRLGARFDSRNEASFLFNTTFRNLTGHGSVLSFDLALAGRSAFDGTYFVHTGIFPGLGVRLNARFNEKPIDFYAAGTRELRIRGQEYAGEIFVGSLFSSKILFGAGLKGEIDRTFPDIAPTSYQDTTRYIGAVFSLFQWDTFDRTDFPRVGHSLKIQGEYASKSLGGDTDFRRIAFDWRTAIPFSRKVSLLTRVQAGHIATDKLPFQKQFFLGGVDSFVGLRTDEIFDRNMQAFMIGLQIEPWKRRYLILRYNAGNVFPDWRFTQPWREFTSGVGVTLGVQTPLGPAEISFVYNRVAGLSTPFNLGYKF